MIVPKDILNQHVAILGKTRSGKSSVMRGLVENLLDRNQPVCIIDPKGDWWGLKLDADGKRPGFPVVIFGGEHADVHINEHAGATVAQLFATGNRPCLIDLGGWMVGPRTKFWIDFASTLFKHTRGQRWLAIDEIHNFAPKGKIFDVEAGKALHWTNRLASEGLGKGVSMLFASQRPQKVHNDTLTSAETLIAMRVLHPSDRAAVSDWIKGCGDSEGSEVLGSLAQMDRGEAWVWSPEIGFGPKRVKFPLFRTYDSFRAQSLEDTKRLKGWAEVDLDDVRAKMAQFEQEAKAEDPRELRKQIAELKKQVENLNRQANVKTSSPVKIVEKLVFKDGQLARVERLFERADKFKALLQEIRDETVSLTGAVLQAKALVDRQLTTTVIAERPARVWAQVAPAQTTSRPARVVPPESSNGHLGKGERAVLIAVAQQADSGATREQLSVLTGYTKSSRNTYLQRLGADGLVQSRGDRLFVTETGLETLGADFEPLPTGDALRRWWDERLSGGEQVIMRVIASVWPQSVGRETISDTTGYTKSSRNTYLQRLSAKRLIVVTGGDVKASDQLFD